MTEAVLAAMGPLQKEASALNMEFVVVYELGVEVVETIWIMRRCISYECRATAPPGGHDAVHTVMNLGLRSFDHTALACHICDGLDPLLGSLVSKDYIGQACRG